MFSVDHLRPLEDLFLSSPGRVVVSFVLGWVTWVLEAYAGLISVRPVLAVGVVSLIAIDFLSGAMKSVVAEGKPLTSYGLRQTLVKIIEYTLFILSLDIILGMTQSTVAADFVEVGSESVIQGAYILVAITEFKSTQENLQRISVDDIRDVIKGRFRLFSDDSEDNDG